MRDLRNQKNYEVWLLEDAMWDEDKEVGDRNKITVGSEAMLVCFVFILRRSMIQPERQQHIGVKTMDSRNSSCYFMWPS